MAIFNSYVSHYKRVGGTVLLRCAVNRSPIWQLSWKGWRRTQLWIVWNMILAVLPCNKKQKHRIRNYDWCLDICRILGNYMSKAHNIHQTCAELSDEGAIENGKCPQDPPKPQSESADKARGHLVQLRYIMKTHQPCVFLFLYPFRCQTQSLHCCLVFISTG